MTYFSQSVLDKQKIRRSADPHFMAALHPRPSNKHLLLEDDGQALWLLFSSESLLETVCLERGRRLRRFWLCSVPCGMLSESETVIAMSLFVAQRDPVPGTRDRSTVASLSSLANRSSGLPQYAIAQVYDCI